MKKLAIILGLFGGICFTAAAQAQQGDVDAGQKKAQVCAACHGADGNSASDMYPKLAGQHPQYLAKQLREFRLASQTGGEKGRSNPIMMGQAANLSDQDILDLAAYFASKEMKPGATPKDMIEKAADLYRRGKPEEGMPSCAGCHGPRGNGMGLAAFPDISGQHVAYLKSQLEMFRSGKRNNDPNGMMRGVASNLTDEDIKLLTNYLNGLH